MKTTFGGNSGYVGFSESVRSLNAKNEGKYPKTMFKEVYGISEKKFKELLLRDIIGTYEWHHTSKYGNKTAFYEINDKCLFYLLLGDKTTAFSEYKKTRNYESNVIKNKHNNNEVLFIARACDFAFNSGLEIGNRFAFGNQLFEVSSKTKHRHYPVCKIIKRISWTDLNC